MVIQYQITDAANEISHDFAIDRRLSATEKAGYPSKFSNIPTVFTFQL